MHARAKLEREVIQTMLALECNAGTIGQCLLFSSLDRAPRRRSAWRLIDAQDLEDRTVRSCPALASLSICHNDSIPEQDWQRI